MSPLDSITDLQQIRHDLISKGVAQPDKAVQVAKDFESMFASQLLKEIRKTLDSEAMFGSDPGDVFGGMFDLFLGQQMAQNGGFGLARFVTDSLPRESPVSGFHG